MKPLIMSVVILGLIGVVPIGTGSAQRPDLSDQLQSSLLYQELWKALEDRQNEVEAHPDSEVAYCRLGEVYLSLFASSDKAEAAFEKSISINPNHAPAFNGLGWARLDLNGSHTVFRIPAIRESPDGFEKAIEAFEHSLRLSPQYSEAYLGLGMAYGRLGRYVQSIEAYQHALSLGLNCPEVYSQLALTYRALGRYEQALQAFRTKVRINSEHAGATRTDSCVSFIPKKSDDLFWDYTSLGGLYSKLGRYDESIGAYKQAISILPEIASVHRALALAYLVLGDKESALAESKVLMDMSRNSQEDGAEYMYRTTAEDIIREIEK